LFNNSIGRIKTRVQRPYRVSLLVSWALALGGNWPYDAVHNERGSKEKPLQNANNIALTADVFSWILRMG